MSNRLVVCSSCGRHVFASEPKCPFCESSLARRIVAGVATASAGLALLGCPDKQVKPEPDASPVASASASTSASSSASASAAIDAGADADSIAAALSMDGGNFDLSVAASDGGLGHGLRQFSAVYGPALNAGSDAGLKGPAGQCSVTAPTASVPIKDAERVLASLRPRFRAVYNSGLNTDPTQKGTFSYTANINADGSVKAVDGKGPFSAAVIDGMKRVLQNSQFEAPGKPSVLTGTVVCTNEK